MPLVLTSSAFVVHLDLGEMSSLLDDDHLGGLLSLSEPPLVLVPLPFAVLLLPLLARLSLPSPTREGRPPPLVDRLGCCIVLSMFVGWWSSCELILEGLEE